jgi:hypothetical protein
MIQENLKIKLSRGTNVLIKAAAIAAAVVSLGAGYTFFLSYIYIPKVEVLEVDFSIGKARLRILSLFPKIIEIDGETIYQIAADWGVRLGSVNVAGVTKYNRIELVRKNMVVQYLNKPKEM